MLEDRKVEKWVRTDLPCIEIVQTMPVNTVAIHNQGVGWCMYSGVVESIS